MKLIAIALTILLTGCSTPPRFLANYYNSQDHCQRDPSISYCGSTSGRVYIYNNQNRQQGYIK